MSSKQLRQIWKEEYCKEWFQFILDNPEYKWNYNYLSGNPNITWDIVKDNLEIPWDYQELSYNKMTKGFNDYMEKKEKLYNTAYKIIDRHTNRDIAEMIMSI